MADTAGTVEFLALELGIAIKPLQDLLTPELFLRLGVELPQSISTDQPLLSALEVAGVSVRALEPNIEQLSTGITNKDVNQILSSSIVLFESIKDLVIQLKTVGSRIDNLANGLPPIERDQLKNLATDFATRTLEYLLVGYIDKRLPNLTNTFALLGIIDKEPRPSPKLDVSQAANDLVPRRFYFDRLPKLFTQPQKHLTEAYNWATPGFDAKVLFGKVQDLLESLGSPATIYDLPGGNQTLEAYAFNIDLDESSLQKGLLFNLSLPGNTTFNHSVDFSSLWKGTVEIEANYAAGMEVKVLPPFKINANPPSGEVELKTTLGLLAEKPANERIDILSIANGTRLDAKSIGGSFGIRSILGTSGGDVEPTVSIFIDDGKLISDTSEGDGFIQKILSAIKINADFSIAAIWTPDDGLSFQGDAGIEILIPLHIDLGVLFINGLNLRLGITNEIPLQVRLATEIRVELGPLKVVVENIGSDINFKFPSGGDGNFGVADVDFNFKPPNGLGLSIDASVIKGGGYLSFDFDREEYAGALELVISEWIAVKAIGLVTTRLPDGSKGFSMVIIISVEFGTGIQLGLGFTLLGVGGLLGLNRTVSIDPLAEGVRTGTVENIMFPKDVVANAPKIISDLKAFFPAKKDQFLIGPMAKIGYGTPTLVSLTLGVIIEFPDVSITILGVLKVALPDENAEVLKLQVNFIGRIEPSNKLLWFEARLFDSRILFITIEGGMGLLVKWGDDSNFVFSVGGFHPRYNPPPLPFPEPPRLAISILNESYARIRIEGYFALTSNTVQFGARAELYFGFSVLNVDGHLGFDALFQFDPFYFIFEFSVGLSVKFFGFGLFTLSVSGLLEGPTKWHIKGKARWKITWFGPTIKVNIDETWGENRQTELPPIEIFPLIEREFDAITNWEAVVPVNGSTLVCLRKLGESEPGSSENTEVETRTLVLHPVGTLRISQRKVPIKLKLDKFGNQKPSDVNEFSVSAAISSGDDLTTVPVREQFAPGEFIDLDNTKKLSSAGFEHYESGIEVRPEGEQLKTSMAVKRNIRYETIIIDNNFKRFKFEFFRDFISQFTILFGVLFNHFLKGNAVTKSTLSKHYQDLIQPNPATITVVPQQFIVANTQNNKPVLDENGQQMTHFNSQMEAVDFMKKQINQNPETADQMHVIPNTEVNTAA